MTGSLPAWCRQRAAHAWAALVGVVAAVCTLAVAELVAVLISPESGPIFAVGE